MAAVKRKREAGDANIKSSSKRSRTDKKSKSSEPKRDPAKEHKEPKRDHKPTATNSVLAKEQPAFPRGGAGLLTPIERKQIHAKAVRDAAAEQSQSRGLFDVGTGVGDLASDHEVQTHDVAVRQPKTKKQKHKGSKDKEKMRPTKVGGLSYKRIVVGTLVLGQVTAISSRDLTLALPNNLVGYVPLTSISKQLSHKIQTMLEDDSNSQGDEDDEAEDVLLKDYFYLGQYLRAAVTATGQDSDTVNSKTRKRLELTIEPGAVNVGLNKSSTVVGSMVQVSVASIEDHGFVADVDFEDVNTRGFVPRSSLFQSIPLSTIRTGSVCLCQVTNVGSNGKVLKLCADPSKFVALKTAPDVDNYLPGTLTDVLVTEVQETAAIGKIMGMINATTDLVHSGAYSDHDHFHNTFKVGKKVRGRIICNFPSSDEYTVGFSVLDNVVQLDESMHPGAHGPSNLLSSRIPEATVVHVERGLGVYLALGDNRFAFAHISRLADKRVDTISPTSGTYISGSQHQVRVLDFNPLDNLYMVSLQDSVIRQPFLRVEDVTVGAVVRGIIEKVLVGPAGVRGLIVHLAEGVSAYVPELHLSDVVLQNPEKKFREGGSVKARVLATDPSRRQIQLTLKKTLVDSDLKIWETFDAIQVGDSGVGTLVRVDANGALVQFYGLVKGFLPVSEMSEAYIKDAREHFTTGQVLTMTAISVDTDQQRLTLSCRGSSFSRTTENSNSFPTPGSILSGVIFEKSEDDVKLRLEGSGAIGRLTLDHVADGSLSKRQSALSKMRVNQRLDSLLVLDVQAKRRLVVLCNRASLVKAAKDGIFLKDYGQLDVGARLTGYVSNITSDGIFISYASRITGLIPPRNITPDDATKEDFGVKRFQILKATVTAVDYKGVTPRFWLTLKDRLSGPNAVEQPDQHPPLSRTLSDPIDSSLEKESELVVGKVTKARIISVKDTQLNVEIARDVHGRVDVSEVYDSWDDIRDRKKPLRRFSSNQVLDVKVLGAHDSRNHRFLPLSHRKGTNTVYELTVKPKSVKGDSFASLGYEDLQVGSSWVAFVNNIGHDCLWVSISPSVRGRLKVVDVADDLSLASNLPNNFPLGSALRVRVLAVDSAKGRLDLTARTGDLNNDLTITGISPGMILPGRVTKVTDRQLLVQLSDSLAGAVDLIDLADDYTQADPASHQKNEVVRVCVVRVDAANKKINLSLRPSRVLSASLPVVDPEIRTIDQLRVNDIYNGFIRNVDDKGVFVTLGHGITAYIRISHLSDSYLKDWKDNFQRDQQVRGKIISVDKDSGHVQMSLKESVMNSDYTPPITFSDLKVGDIVTGKVAKVQEFGVFVVLANSENIRGLCHRSEIAEQRVDDASKLFSEGDVVKVKVLKIDAPKRRVNFGMKASYFRDADVDDLEDQDDAMEPNEDESVSDEAAEVRVDTQMIDAADDVDTFSEDDISVKGSGPESFASGTDLDLPQEASRQGLQLGGFDWHGIVTNPSSIKRSSAITESTEDDSVEKKKKRKKRAEIQVDRTGDLDANGPQSVDDYERLLLGEPDSSLLWLQYMAFHLELGDIDQARQIGERALKSIGLGEDAEKMNVWVAMLNLENAYGDDDSVEATFKRACEYNDAQEMHTRLTSIYIQSGKHGKADELFQQMLKKFTQDPKVWVNYGTFLFDTMEDAEKGRDVLSRALQILPKFTYLDVTLKFAQLEFKSRAGLAERGRTIFEGLMSSFPKRIDLYNVLLDLEMKLGDKNQIRSLFQRIFTSKLKPKQAKFFFKRWLAFEEKEGDGQKIEDVKARAATWIRVAGSE